MNENEVVVVILAAGAARRFGRPKQLERWPAPEGPTLVERAVKIASEAQVSAVYVVTGNQSTEVNRVLSQNAWTKPVKPVFNPRWQDGQGFSVAAGVRTVVTERPACAGILFMLADQPRLQVTTLELLISRFEEAGQAAEQAIFFPVFNGKRGNPVLFGRYFFEELAQLEGDTGGRTVMRAHPQAAQEVEVNDPAIHEDVDTQDDLQNLKAD
ncbi:MAG TPA: nucleotidyltransferase family protein [Chloroflexia bacterium]|nr:nucleotidyltransferase family protein [Chloroflexia bacterium]